VNKLLKTTNNNQKKRLPEVMTQRKIIHIDMDTLYVQATYSINQNPSCRQPYMTEFNQLKSCLKQKQ